MSGQETPRFKVVRLAELDAVPGPGTLTWRPVRATLGINAFGTNAYTASETGLDVVEPHDEVSAGHEELYFVASGRARFVVDGTEFEAEQGTYVFLPEPGVHRRATALEPGTTVLSFGGPPDFKPSAWEWVFRADPLVDSDPERARAIVEEGLRTHPTAAGLHWVLARLESRAADTEAALSALSAAIGRNPRLASEARRHPDLASLRDDPRFQAIVEDA